MQESSIEVNKVVIVLVSAKSNEEAESISSKLVAEELCACASIIQPVKSIYRWKGEVLKSDEVIIIIKTSKNLISTLTERIKELHSYDVPEIIATVVTDGNKDYLEWVLDSVANKKHEHIVT
ncbi:putative CutA1 divalent ion tolerance protein [Cryptosporidium serpentis]